MYLMSALLILSIALVGIWVLRLRSRRVPDLDELVSSTRAVTHLPFCRAGGELLGPEMATLRRLSLAELLALRAQAVWLERFHRGILEESRPEDAASQMITRRLISITLSLPLVYAERFLSWASDVPSALFEIRALSLYWDIVSDVRVKTQAIRPDLMAVAAPYFRIVG